MWGPGCGQGRALALRQTGKNKITGSGNGWEIYRAERASRETAHAVTREKAPNLNETRVGVFIRFRDKTRRRGRQGVPNRKKQERGKAKMKEYKVCEQKEKVEEERDTGFSDDTPR